jgi:riboflavin kinase/FMN adenylyltransferase
MKTLRDLREARQSTPTWLTIGNFDGMHLGHQALVARTVQRAKETGARSALLTFNPHPAAVLRPGTQLLHLATPWERLRLAAEIGAEIGIIQPFTLEMAALGARDFVLLLCEHLRLAGLVVGPDFALGRKREGDLPTLRALGAELGFVVDVVDAVTWQGQPVRSSAVRDALQSGDLATANAMLGRTYALSGVVTLGDQRGRTIGVPTANVQPHADAVVPANGVYATRATLALPDSVWTFVAATNVGTRPTVDGLHRRIEAHLLDFPPATLPDDLYGQTLTIEFVQRLRDEVRFSGLNALIAQIQSDIARTREVVRS